MPRFPGRLGLQNGANMASKNRPKTGQNRIIFWFVLEALLEPSWSPLGALLEPSWPPKSSQHGPPKPPKNGPETCHFEVSNRLPLGSLQKAPRGLQKASRKPPETSKKLPRSLPEYQFMDSMLMRWQETTRAILAKCARCVLRDDEDIRGKSFNCHRCK